MIRKFLNRLPLRFSIAVPFTLLILITAGAAALLSYRRGQSAVYQLTNDLHKQTIAHTEQVLRDYLSTPILINQLNLNAIRLGTFDVQNLSANEGYFMAQIRQFTSVISIAYANERGEYIGPFRNILGLDLGIGILSAKTGFVPKVYAISAEGTQELNITVEKYDPLSRPWYQVAVQAGREVWTPIYLWSFGEVGIDAVLPVYSEDQQLIGVLDTSLTLNAISEYLQSLKVSEHSNIFIIDKSGFLVASSTIHEPITRVGDEIQRLSVMDADDPVMKAAVQALEKQAGALENITDAFSLNFPLSNEMYLARVAPQRDEYGLDWLIVTIIPISDSMAQINAGNRQTGIFIGLSLLASIILASLISVGVTRPILQLTDSAKALASGDWRQRIRVDHANEIGELALSFNDMANQLQSSFESLQANEQRYQSLFEDSPVSLWEEDYSDLKKYLNELRQMGVTNWQDFFTEHPEEIISCAKRVKINNVNRATMAVFEAGHKDAFSNGLFPFFTQKTVKAFYDELIALANGNLSFETDTVYRTHTGEEIIVHIQLSVLPGYEDSWSKVLVSMEDITDRMQAEEALRKSEEIYRQAIEAADAVPYRQSYSGAGFHVDYDFIGDGILQITGYTPDEFSAPLWDKLVIEKCLLGDLAEFSWIEAVRKVRAGDIPAWKCEYLIQARDGAMRWVFESGVELRDEDGNSYGSVGLFQDITVRKLAEVSLREKTDELERFFTSALDLLCIADTDGYFRLLNREWENVLGYRLENLEGKRFLDLVHPDDLQATLDTIAKLDSQKEINDFTNRYRCKDGTYRWLEWRAVPYGKLIYATARNVTERVLAEERMKELTRRLVTAQEEERKRIAQELHDELGQVLTAISLDLGSIAKILPPGTSSEITERVNDARSLADEVDERISELALDLRPSMLDDLGLLPTLQWYLNRYMQRLGIEVTMDFTGMENRLPDEVVTALYRVIQEALTNIAKHAQASVVRLKLEGSPTVVRADIEDNGVGFDAIEAQSSISAPDSMGLLGIKDRVSTLGGRVEIQSRPGHGTRIQIEIPLTHKG